MKKIYLIFCLIVSLSIIYITSAYAVNIAKGYIYLQVEEHGEAWYVYPGDGKRYYLGRPEDAFTVMQKLALGATHDYLVNTTTFPKRLSGTILLDTGAHGEAYYIYPGDLKKYYLGRPTDAFAIMRNLGKGITNADIMSVSVGDITNAKIANPPADATVANPNTKILLNVPFTSQAPFGNWKDMRQEDGCEEASALMAVSWARGESLSASKALEQIIAISDFEQKKYGEYRDISAADTVLWIFNDYFGFKNVEFKKSVSLSDIISELKNGKVIIVPMNGQVLNNPHFTSPGPVHHMLVIKGYDPVRNVFITNDPGTRYGQSYEYDANHLYSAIRDYPTGYHKTSNTIEKNMIVVWE